MVAHCTCGSPLPDGASFCPRCGRPLHAGIGEPFERAFEARDEPSAQLPPGMDAYVRAAFLPALGAVCVRLAILGGGALFAWLGYLVPGGAGFLAVRRFEKRHPVAQGGWQGFGIGALTGLACFVPSFLLLVSVLATQGREAILGPMRDQVESLGLGSEVQRLLEDPAVFAMMMAFSMAFEALLLVLTAGAGGAIAARAGGPKRG